MAGAEIKAAKLVLDIGNQLAARKTCPNKDFIIKLLKQASSSLLELKQTSSLKPAIKPLSDSLIKHGLLLQKDKDVRLLVAICFCEIIRILAPDPGFSDEVVRDIFKLFLSIFEELADTQSPYFLRRVKLLETVAKLEFCVLMLDLDTDTEDLVLDMFNTFFNVVREDCPPSLVSAMSWIIALIFKAEVSEPHFKVILQNLLKEDKDTSPVSFQLAVSVIQSCREELEPFVCQFLRSCMEKDAVATELEGFYHEIIFQIFQFAPKMLFAIIPNLTQELMKDRVDARIKAINLIGRLFMLPENHFSPEYRPLFIEFLNRFSDKSTDVRLSALLCAKSFYVTNRSGTESFELLAALKGRLLDFDDKVRTQAVTMVSDLARSNVNSFPPELISRAAERLRDTKASKVGAELAEELFPASLSMEERTRHWMFLFSLFTPAHLKALNTILSQKRRLVSDLEGLSSSSSARLDAFDMQILAHCKSKYVDNLAVAQTYSLFGDMSKTDNIWKKVRDTTQGDKSHKTIANHHSEVTEARQELDYYRVFPAKCRNDASAYQRQAAIPVLSTDKSALAATHSMFATPRNPRQGPVSFTSDGTTVANSALTPKAMVMLRQLMARLDSTTPRPTPAPPHFDHSGISPLGLSVSASSGIDSSASEHMTGT
ncbi:hypothetical protein RJ639_010650 [Escallonia herrerae]|uniref:Uncharacterized protein n=1 Tax=Escallonia herrerae TaxID=1293975 RepID=A0AA89APY3_9ASTE|nr:hypothetical protein RJ639_010650 [Escallonia herrerae]